jgi:Family of unknown function (DUF6526)
MAEQTYANHPHRPWQTNIAVLFWLLAVVAVTWRREGFPPWLFNAAVLMTLLTLIAMTRTYTTRLQDRIILLEMKVRAAEVLAAGEDAKLGQLSKAQIVALRFASDEEFSDLLDRAIRDKLSPKEIKLAIRNWKADHHRT